MFLNIVQELLLHCVVYETLSCLCFSTETWKNYFYKLYNGNPVRGRGLDYGYPLRNILYCRRVFRL